MATTTHSLTLFCLLDGEPTSRAFSIDIKPTESVHDLKELIKASNNSAFNGVDTRSLTLWKVVIPENSHGPNLAITMDALDDDGKTELYPMDDISEIFAEEPDENTYILVQQPPPRPQAPSNRLKVIPYKEIEKELVSILDGVRSRHIPYDVDLKDAVTFQMEKLGPFYKRTLPYLQTARDTKLVMLGLELDKQARTSQGETLSSIVEDDVRSISGHSVVAMVAPSGSGKTATVIELAGQQFVVYFVCGYLYAMDHADIHDREFITLGHDVERIHDTVSCCKHSKVLRQPHEIDFHLKILVRERVELEFLARILFLQLLLDINHNLEPLQFFREQTNDRGSVVATLVYTLRKYDSQTISKMLDKAQYKLRSSLFPKRQGLVVVIDRAHVADGVLLGKFISQSALVNNWNNRSALLDDNNQVQRQFRCGFLASLSATLSHMQATLVILGTATSLQEVDSTGIPPAKLRMLSGRVEFSIGIIRRLADSTLFTHESSKQHTLDDAVDKTIEHLMSWFRRTVRTILEYDTTGENVQILCQMVLAYHLHEGKVSFSSRQPFDLVNKGLCRLQPHHDGMHLVMDEPIVIEAVQRQLEASHEDFEFWGEMVKIERLASALDMTLATGGTALEQLIRRSLQRFNGYRLVDLPFLQGVSLPSWCDDLRLQVDEIDTATGFGYTDGSKNGSGGTGADLAFMANGPPNKMFTHEVVETSTDVRRFFLNKDATAFSNPSLPSTPLPSCLKGILRIHLEFPAFQRCGLKPSTHVKKDSATGSEDVMVYIDLSNMDDFFYKPLGAGGDEEDMLALKSLIKYVSNLTL
ncbi:hypothetical protein BGZ95_011531 [Linnemannia exigua]|uniref:Crinkler effector protein N-terminal domain-containing protein n=1 Tax=Linnemannia exigua TaxID=604196 RepID=A0AAD4DJU3_9FUNG|nr:hypothetical protein BGZ95_011531 [Linnemannia exigua]